VTAPDPLTAWLASLDPAALLAHPAATGAGIRVAVIDTGLDGEVLHQRHRATVAASLRFVPDHLEPLPASDVPASPHGTSVADVILSLAPSVELYSADVFGARGTCEVEALMRACRHALDTWRCRVINLSLGVSEGQLIQVPRRLALQRLMEEAYFRDVMVVAAAGNDHPLTRSYPAAFGPPVFGVDRHDGTDPRDIRYAPRERIEFTAPGRARFGALASVPATSWAAPHVTGVIAQLLSLRPGLRPFEVKSLLARLGPDKEKRRHGDKKTDG
jgi:subtilisin family serine protease